MVDVLLLRTLEDLGKEDYEKFKWFLNQENLAGVEPIAWSKLQYASRIETVSQMTRSYGKETAMKVAVEILKKMKNMYAAEELTKKYAAASPPASSPPASSPPAASPPAASPPAASPQLPTRFRLRTGV
ncbi:Interferon-inducible protein AIM2 [Dissostichus eleginoides]|uniref:Interferon-inducible protein AIM2 n=1 Tax=Dissostichus eleginoides TaxID=100907 RepID=A0AAD9BNP8_DISEL|nr:Interferon-inducible protein AIM2 [Dissostichus eleginoides]